MMNMQATVKKLPVRHEKTEASKNVERAREEDAVSVLVVEDNDSERWRICAMLQKLGYLVRDVSDGDEALSRQLEEPSDLVVSDWRMPGMDGLELCRVLRTEADYQTPYFIMLTGMNNPVDLIAGMEAGADDFIAKPCSAEELRVRIMAGARTQRLRHEHERVNLLMRHLLRRERRAMNRIRADLEAAAELQQSLLPCDNARFDHYSVATLFQPASEVGGDFYNYFRLGSHHLGFYSLDVNGLGVRAAMMAFGIANELSADRGAIGLLMDDSLAPRPPADVITNLNARFQDNRAEGRHFTMVYGTIDLRDGSGLLCRAGHPHPVLLKQSGGAQLLGSGGCPVGIWPAAEFENAEFRLERGDRLVLCTDGLLTEFTKDSDGDLYTNLTQRISEEAAEDADGVIEAFRKLLAENTQGSAFEDDVSALAISLDRL